MPWNNKRRVALQTELEFFPKRILRFASLEFLIFETLFFCLKSILSTFSCVNFTIWMRNWTTKLWWIRQKKLHGHEPVIGGRILNEQNDLEETSFHNFLAIEWAKQEAKDKNKQKNYSLPRFQVKARTIDAEFLCLHPPRSFKIANELSNFKIWANFCNEIRLHESFNFLTKPQKLKSFFLYQRISHEKTSDEHKNLTVESRISELTYFFSNLRSAFTEKLEVYDIKIKSCRYQCQFDDIRNLFAQHRSACWNYDCLVNEN